MKKYSIILLCAAALAISSCEDDGIDNVKQIDNPTTYEFTRNGESTVSFSGQTERIFMATELISNMKDPNISLETLQEMFANQTATGGDVNPFSNPTLNESTKSVKSKVAASADFFTNNAARSAVIRNRFDSWIERQVSEVFPNWEVLAEPGIAGQIADGSTARYVSAQGIEYDQAVAKSLIGAMMGDQINNHYVSLTVLDEASNIADNDAGVVVEGQAYTNMEHKWDEAYGYLFGGLTNTTDPNTVLGSDAFLNKYLGRVEGDSDFAGIADDMFQAFKLGRAAIVAGDYTTRDEQARLIRDMVNTVIAVRAVFYLQQGKTALAGGDYGGGFHDLSEGIGFVYSLQFLRDPGSDNALFSATEVDGFMDQLTTGNGFWDVTATTLDAMSEAIANKFDFTVTQAGSL